MMPGIVASTEPAGSAGGGVDYYTGATVVADFENGVYKIGGVDAAVADMIDNVDTITASGLVLDWNAEPVVPEIALLAAVTDAIDFSAGWSVLLDIVQYDVEFTTGTNGVLLRFWNGTYDIPGRHEFEIDSKATTVEGFDQRRETVGNSNRAFTVSTALGEGVERRIMVTRAADRLAACLNGGSVTQDTSDTAGTPSFTTFTLGGNPGDGYLSINCVVKKLIFYPPLANVLLPSYTA